MRACPRCGAFCCPKCGVASRGTLVCRACEHAPDPAREERPIDMREIFALTRLPPAFGGALLGAAVGGVVWAGIAAVTGVGWGLFGAVTGVGARLGLWIGARTRVGCLWPFVAAAAVPFGYLLGRWFVSAALVRAAGGNPPLFGSEVGRKFAQEFGGWSFFVELGWIALAMLVAATIPRRGA